MNSIKAGVGRGLEAVDRWQRSHRWSAILLAVVKKFGEDRANQCVVALGWYGFVAIYPLLLVVVTVLGFVGAPSLGHHLVATLHQFPIVGPQFDPGHAGSSLHGSRLGLVVGLAGLLYGAQGVTQTAQQSMVTVWNLSDQQVPGFLDRLRRSLGGLVVIGGTFVVNAGLAALATGTGQAGPVRALVIAGMALVNLALFTGAFRILTPTAIPLRSLGPGAAVASVGFTFLITLGSGLVQHQIRRSSATYGQFGVVIGLVAFLFLLAKITLYGAELNSVLRGRLWPRSLRTGHPTAFEQADLVTERSNQGSGPELVGAGGTGNGGTRDH